MCGAGDGPGERRIVGGNGVAEIGGAMEEEEGFVRAQPDTEDQRGGLAPRRRLRREHDRRQRRDLAPGRRDLRQADLAVLASRRQDGCQGFTLRITMEVRFPFFFFFFLVCYTEYLLTDEKLAILTFFFSG